MTNPNFKIQGIVSPVLQSCSIENCGEPDSFSSSSGLKKDLHEEQETDLRQQTSCELEEDGFNFTCFAPGFISKESKSQQI